LLLDRKAAPKLELEFPTWAYPISKSGFVNTCTQAKIELNELWPINHMETYLYTINRLEFPK